MLLCRTCKLLAVVPAVHTLEGLGQRLCQGGSNLHSLEPSFADDITTTADGHDTYHLVKAAGRYK